MARSFFGRTDADLLHGSRAFAAKISADPQSFGLSEAQAAAYQELNDIYAACYLAALTPATRTKSRVSAKNDSRARLRQMAGELARIIRGTASVSDEQKINLGLTVPGRPEAVASLGKPERLKVTLWGGGALMLKWTCVNPRATGTVYQVWRRIAGGQGEFLGISGKRRFVDYTLPAGASYVIYEIQAVRSTAFGPKAMFPVSIGGCGGAMMKPADQTEGKMAA